MLKGKLDGKTGENMLEETKIKLGKIGVEGLVIGVVLCMLIGMIPTQAAQAEGTETMGDVQYTIYGTVYGIDGITPAKDVFVMATNTTGYGDYTYTDKNGSYAIVLNWTYNTGDLVIVTAINSIRMGNTSFTVTSNNNVEVNIVLQTIPEWWPDDPREIPFESESGNSTSKTSTTSTPTKGIGEQGQRSVVSKTTKANMENYNADLVIPDYQEYENTELNLYQCNLIVESGGRLVLRNTTVTVWNNDTEANYGISVLSNETSIGVLEVLDNSIIQAPGESGYYYHFNVYGRLLVDHSIIKWMSGEGLNHTNPDVTMPSGIRLYPDSRCTIQNNTLITGGRTHNIYADAATLTIKDSIVSLAGNSTMVGYGVYATNVSRVTIERSVIECNANHGIFVDECSMTITGSDVRENGGYGIYCHSFAPTISRNNITNNMGGIFCHSSSPTITYNNIIDNSIGVRTEVSSPTLLHNNILDGRKQESTYGVYSYFSSFTAVNNTVSGYENGFYLYYSPLSMLNNTVTGNLIGIYTDNSGASIKGNNISLNEGAGIYSELSTDVEVIGNVINDNHPQTLEAEGYGVYVKRSTVLIQDNVINGNGRAGIYYGESNSGVYSGIVMGNVIGNQYTVTGKAGDRKSMGTGIFCVNASVTISDNEIIGNVEGIVSISTSATISKNDIISNTGFSEYTLEYWYQDPRTGERVRVTETRTTTIGCGISTENTYSKEHATTISNNNISENHNGIVCEYNSYADIVNNNITSNDYGLWFDESSSGDWSITDTSTVRDNEIWLNGNLTVYNGGSIMLQTTAPGSQCYFMLNPKQDGMYQIEVLNGGTLTADNFGFYSATDYHYLFKVRDGGSLTLTDWSGIGYCGYNSTLPENMGLFIESNNVLIENCWFQENYCGIVLSGTDVGIVNTTFDYNTWDMCLRDASAAECLNTTFDEDKVWFEDGVSILNVSWYLHVNVMNGTGTGVEDASVTVYDKDNNIVFNGLTSSDGWIKNIPIHDYTRNQTSTIIYTPHNITATKTGVGSVKQSNVTMDCTKSIALILYNTVPTLSAPSVFPEEHDIDITFNYTVTYTDEDNDAPEYVKVNISGVLRPSNEYWGMVYDMKKADTNDTTYTDGCNYYFSTRLPKGNFTYRFETMDWQNTTATTIFCGPNITNRPPFIMPIIDQEATVGYRYLYSVNASDRDNDPLIYTLLEAPLGMQINSTVGLITWIPLEEQVGDNTVTVEVSDNDIDGTVYHTFMVRVHLNYPPILLTHLPDISFDEDTILPYALNLSNHFKDINNDALTYTYYHAVNINVTINQNSTVNFSAKKDWHGTETITFRATDPNGGYAEDTVKVTVNPMNDPPIADAGLDQKVVANETYGRVRLAGTAYDPDGNIALYEWDFGDSSPTWSHRYTGTTAHTYSTPGNYTATFRATDNNGATTTDTCMVYALELGWDLPVADAAVIDNDGVPGDNVFCVGHTVTVTGSNSYDPGWFNPPNGTQGVQNGTPGQIVSYDWDWRDMSPHSGDCDSSHVYDTPGLYEVVLTVYDNQSFTNTDTCTFLVVEPPTPDAGVDQTVSADCTVYVMLSGKGVFKTGTHGSIVNYTWEFGDGSYGYKATMVHGYEFEEGLKEKVYTANLTVTDSYGFSTTDTCVIRIVDNFAPIVDVVPTIEKSTKGEAGVEITIQGRGYDRDGSVAYYLWDFDGDGTYDSNSTTGTGTHWYSLDGNEEKTYTTNLMVVDNKGGTGTGISTVHVVAHARLGVYITPYYKATFGNRSVNFTAYAYGGDGGTITYSWEFKDGGTGNKQSVSHFYAKPPSIKDYWVKVTAQEGSAKAIATATVKVYSNWEPIVFMPGNQIKYVENSDSEENRTAHFLVMGVDVDDSIKSFTVDFGDGNSIVVGSFSNLTDDQKKDFAKNLTIITSNSSSDNPLYAMLEDVMWMYDQGMLLILEAGLIALKVGVEVPFIVDAMLEIVTGLLQGDYIDKIGEAIAEGRFADALTNIVEIPIDVLIDVYHLFEKSFNLFEEARKRGLEHSVGNFMVWAYHDLCMKWGLEQPEPLITRDELMSKIVGFEVNHTYAKTDYPRTYTVNVTATDNDGAEGNGTTNVTFIDNVLPFALTDKEISGRINENVAIRSYALDYESNYTNMINNISLWEWDLDNDGYFEWNNLRNSSIPGNSSPSYEIKWFDKCGVIGPVFNYTYSKGGVYWAVLRVTDHKGLNTTIPLKIVIYPLADAGADKTYRVKKDVPFSGMGQTLDAEIREYKWDFDNNMNWGWDKTFRPSGKSVSKGGHTIASGWFNTTWEYKIEYEYIAIFGIEDETETGTSSSAEDICIVTITPNHAPVANAGPDQTVKWNQYARFDGSKSYDIDNDALTYTWDFGDGHTGSGVKPTHTYSDIGIYTVILNVSDDELYSIDICKITVTPDAGPDQTVWVGTNVSFNGSGPSTVNSYSWDFGDSRFAAGDAINGYTNVTHTYNVPGNYIATLIMTNTAGASISDECIITVIDNHAPEVQVGPQLGPEVGIGPHLQTYWGLPLTFYATACDRDYPDGSIIKYRWDFDDGTIIEGDAEQDQYYYSFNCTYTYSWFGEYIVNLTVWDERGTSNWSTCNVTIINPYGDIFPPKTNLISPFVGNYSYKDTISLIINITDESDPEPWVVEVWVDETWYKDTNCTITRAYHTATLNITINMTTLTLGSHTLKIISMDKNGNTGIYALNFTVVDNVAPESYIDVISPYWHNESIIITATASDERSNITNVTLYYYNSTDNNTWYGPYMFGVDETSPWMWNFNFPNGEGYYKFYTIAWDEAGNQEYFTVNDTVCGYDITSPESEVNIITPYWQTNNEFTVMANVNDTLSGISNIALYYRYSSDNASWSDWTLYGTDCNTPWQWLFNTSILEGDGYYQFYTIATDVAGNMETTVEFPDTICGVDTGMPTSRITPVSPYWQTNTEFTITANASNGMSGIAEVELFYRYSIDNVSWSNWASYGIDNDSPYEWLFNTSKIYGDGYYQFYSIAKDVSGNIESAPTESDTFCGVDVTSPSSAVTTISPYWQNTTPITTIVDASDITSGIKKVALYYNYSTDNLTGWTGWILYGVNDTTYPYIWLFDVPNGDGYYQFYSIAVDNAGNLQETILSIAICGVDTVAPTIDVTGVVNDTYYNTNIVAYITITDANLDKSTVTLNDIVFTSGTTISAENVYYLNITVSDLAGNTATQNILFTIDKTLPIITITGVTNNEYYNTDVTPVIEISDTYLDTHTITLNDVDFTSGSTVSAEGMYYLTVTAADLAGNTATQSVVFMIDKTKPVITVTGVNNDAYYNTNVTPTINVTDEYFNYTIITLNGIGFVSGATITQEGTHILYVYAEDFAKNNATMIITFTIDKTIPEIIISGVSDSTYYNISITPIISITDINLNTSITTLNDVAFISGTTISADGLYYLNVTATDKAGNNNEIKIMFTIDKTPPTITITGVNDAGYYNVNVTPVIEITDANMGIGTITLNDISFTSGTTVSAENVYYLNITASDLAGNTATQNIVFTIDKTQPTITNITATPTVQEIYGYVNITTTVTDNYYVVDTVEVEIIDPNGAYITVLMHHVDDTDTYYYNASYNLLGLYNFAIRAKDLADNFATGEGNFFIGDTTKPEISNILASPQVQDVFDSVNITCDVVDNVNVKNVYVNITDPQGISVSMLMENMAGTGVYYYNTTYQINGTYQYYVWTVDTSDNRNTSMVYTFNIIQRTTTIIYIGDINGQYSDNIILSAMLMDAKTGTPISNKTLEFTFADYDGVCVTDENGSATVTVTLTQNPGIYTVTAGFLGDEYYLNSSIDINFTVEKENTVLSSPNINIVYSDDATLTVTMIDEEGEPILHQQDEPKTIHLEYYNDSFWIPLGNATLINGTATFELSIPEDFDEIAGIYDIRVRFDGDNRYNPANATGTLTILREDVVISDPSFTIVYSDNATVTITMLDDDNDFLLHEEDVEVVLEFYHTVWKLKMRWDRHTHEIIVYWVRENVWTEIDRTTMINGSITFNVSIPGDFSETAGNYSLRAVFDGNDRYNFASTDGTLTILKENVILSDPSFTIIYMNSTTVTINVTDDDGEELIKYVPSGPFIERDGWRIELYYFNGTEWKLIGTERLSNGGVTFDISMPENLMEMPGVYELMVYFYGNGTYNDAVRYGNMSIIGGETNLTYTGASSGGYSDEVVLSAILTDYFGIGMPNRIIIFTLGNQTVNGTTNETGVATATITLMQIPGNYTLTSEFLGDEYYFSSNTSIIFTIEKEDTILTAYDIVVSDPVNDTLTALLIEDSAPIAGRNIGFYINGTYVGSGVTNESGIATCSVPFLYLFGNFTWMAEFTGDEYYLPSNGTANLSSTHEAKVNGIITMIDKLISDIENSNITDCVASSLISKLQNVKKKVTQENFNAADNIMNAFQNELDAQHGKELSEEQYQGWYSQSENVRYVLQWMMSQ